MGKSTTGDRLTRPDWKRALRVAPESEIRDGIHRRLMWESNLLRLAIWRIRKQDIGHLPAPVLIERWKPTLLWRVMHRLGVV